MWQEYIPVTLLPVIQRPQSILFHRSGMTLELARLNGLPGPFDVGLELDIDEANLAQHLY